MSRYAINPNKLPDAAAEERAALDRERAFESDDSAGDVRPAGRAPLPPMMFVPDPRFPHGDVDELEARLAELQKTRAAMAAPAAPAAAQPQPAEKPRQRAQDNPLIASLVASLPAPESVWKEADRAEWLRAAESLFRLVYRAEKAPEADADIS